MQKRDVIFRLLLPPDQDAAEAIQPAVGAFHHPAAGALAGFPLEFLGLFAPRANMRRKAEFRQDVAHLLEIVAFVQAHPLRLLSGRRWTFYHHALDRFACQFHIVAIGPRDRHTEGHAMPVGQQAAFDAALGTVGGVWPGVFSAQRRFGHRPVHAQPGPIYAFQFIELLHTRLPQLEKHPRRDPFLVTVVGGRTGAQLGFVEGFPLAASAQHVEDRIRTLPVGGAGPASSKAVRIHVNRQQRLQDGPQGVRNPKTGGGLVIGASGTRSFGVTFRFHATNYTTSYSDRL